MADHRQRSRRRPRGDRRRHPCGAVFEGETLDDPALQRLVELGEAKPGLKKVAVTHDDAPAAASAACWSRPRQARGASSRARARGGGRRGRPRARSSAPLAVVGGAARARAWRAPSSRARCSTLYRSTSSSRRGRGRGGGIESLEIVRRRRRRGGVESGRVARRRRRTPRATSRTRRANVATPTWLADRAQADRRRARVAELEVLDRDAIVEARHGRLRRRRPGHPRGAELIVLRYEGGGDGPHLGYVGKAVTFDTGGISIKPAAKMHEMKFDMSGGAAVLEAMDAIAALGATGHGSPRSCRRPRTCRAGTSVKPGDIVTAMNGKTIEVNNTDAEGRLILADALGLRRRAGRRADRRPRDAHGRDHRRARSTHAGSSRTTTTGTRGRGRQHRDRRDRLAAAAAPGVLRADQGPLRRPHQRGRGAQGDVDLRGGVPARSSSTTGPWVHVDIAGTAWGLGRAYVGKGAFGFGVRMLIELAVADRRVATVHSRP